LRFFKVATICLDDQWNCSPNKCFRVQVTDTSQHELFRGDCVNWAFMVELLQKKLLKDTNKTKRLALAKKHKQWILDRWKSVQIWDFWFQPPCLCEMQSRGLDDLHMCGSHREVWRRRCDGVGCYSDDTVSDVFMIQGILNHHGYHSILQWYAILGLHLVSL
jgi:hypothetical protein